MMTPVDPTRTTIPWNLSALLTLLERDGKVTVPADAQESLSSFLWQKGFRPGDRCWIRDAEVSEDGVAVRILRRGDTLLYDRGGEDKPFGVLAVTKGAGKANVFRVGRAFDATMKDARVAGAKVLQVPIEIPLSPLGGAYALIVAPWENRGAGGPSQGRTRHSFEADCDLVALATDTPFFPVKSHGRTMDNPIAIKNLAEGWTNPDGSVYLKFAADVPYLPRTARNRGHEPRPTSDPEGTWWKERMADFLERNEPAMAAAKLLIFPRVRGAE